MVEVEKIVNDALKMGIDEISVGYVERDTKQIRFSNNAPDIYINYIENQINLFLAKKKRTIFTTIKDTKNIEKRIEDLVKILDRLPENNDFLGLNTKKQTYRNHVPDGALELLDDLPYFSKLAIEGAQEKGARRVSGVIYHDKVSMKLATNYNYAEDKNVGFYMAVRAFNEYGFPGQTAFQTASKDLFDKFDPYSIGETAGDFASLVEKPSEGKEGKYDVLFHPLCFGSLVSYSIEMASAFMVDSGMSFFADKINKKMGSENFTLHDDPTMESGIGYRKFDDEGTSTKKVTIVENGIVKSYLHNNSTAKKFNTDTTGNAGLVSPNAWQPVVESGKRSFDDIIADMKKGLFIVNTWYTRFQDYRNGDFSTIPRDGIFYIENGEIVESWQGIRISDNMQRIFSAIDELSSERIQVKWWDEVKPSLMPYALVKDVNITKSR